MAELYPEIEPYDQGMLDAGDGNLVYWETSGNPDGKPAVMVHGGPGQGTSPRMRRQFDPARYRIVLFDQRGCGRSTPHASDPATDMSVNTTAHLIRDMERLRERLGVEKWLLCGGSWGSTLALAYAEEHPDRVSGIVLSAVTSARRAETDWLYRGAAMFFPEGWGRFAAGAGLTAADLAALGLDAPGLTDPGLAGSLGSPALTAAVMAGYARLMDDPDPKVRAQAARDWCTWEDLVLSLEPNPMPGVFSDSPDADMEAMVRICAQYAVNGAWLEEGQLIRNAGRLAGIPGVLIHGRRDLSCPLDTAWALAQAWPDAELLAPADSGHLGSPVKRQLTMDALDRFARPQAG
jgi:proline iminopeptidase